MNAFMMDGRAKELDRVPNLNVLMFFAARYIDKPFGQFCTDYRVMVEGNLRCVEKFGIDIDWRVDMKRTLEIFDGISVVNGNVDLVAIMLNGSVSCLIPYIICRQMYRWKML